ncbi:MAG: hydrogenase 2 operon protein HybA [Bacteroidetes bacterium]|nr:hydrogenase 2 operon protein HybA [Bacteroidota bacterium]
MPISRRNAIGAMITGTAVVAGVQKAPAASHAKLSNKEMVAMLYDTTLCIGCKACVSACAEVNGLVPDTGTSDGLYQMPKYLNDKTKNIIKLYEDEKTGLRTFVKAQCMHCIDPACVAACPMAALTKNSKNGIVEWDGTTCLGCRYCQIACPYNIPKFEWTEVNPKIVKCQFCDHRTDGKGPACCDVCPREAVIYGTREELLRIARKRIADNPGKYYEDKIYGEYEGGGTQVLYLSHIEPKLLGHLVPLDHRSIPEQVESVQNTLYMGFLSPVIVYAALTSYMKKQWHKHEEEAKHVEEKTGLKEQL